MTEENAEIEKANEYIIALHARIMKMMDWDEDKTWVWIGTANPTLGYISPAEMIAYGRYEKLDKFINQAEQELNDLKERVGNGSIT